MTPDHPPSQADALSALKSLVGWWDDAGIAVDIPPAPPPALRTSAPERKSAPAAPAVRSAPAAPEKPAQDAVAMARAATDIAALKAAVGSFDGCELKRTARNTVFARGNAEAPLMVIGEGPGQDEDREGLPFVGRSGQLLDRMLAAIGLDDTSAYITNVVFWRPPGNRKPSTEEIEICRPFVERHIALAKPRLILLVGGISTQAMLKNPQGIMALRGRWSQVTAGGHSAPALPTFHPAFLLRRPQEKAKAWADLLSLQEKLEELS
ncbi:uracil-DNA glycosylase family protein [Glycocaulis sp.]|uniref:uracil-DNA glycosylase n=1 Tax=Glycocaulis sp. TaxID=1969725 RepID=UPI003F7246DA